MISLNSYQAEKEVAIIFSKTSSIIYRLDSVLKSLCKL